MSIYENVRLIPDTQIPDALVWDGQGMVPGTLNNFTSTFSTSFSNSEWKPAGYTGPSLWGVTRKGSCWWSLRNSDPDLIRFNQTSSSTAGPYSSSGVVLFRKRDFAGVLEFGDRLTFSSTDVLKATLVDETQASPGSEEFRWVVRNGSTYYVSQPTQNFGTGASPTLLSQTPTSLTWFAYDPATDLDAIGASITPVFDDIQFIGLRLEGSRDTDGQLRIGVTQLHFDVTISNIPARLNPPPAAQTRLSDGLVDVTLAPYFADNTGSNDARQAIQNAIDDAYVTNLVVFFPSGTYLCDGPLFCIQPRGPTSLGQCKFAHQLVGSTVGARPVLKLNDGAALGTNTNFIRYAWEGDQDGDGDIEASPSRHYCAAFRGIDIDMGNNPTANGIEMLGAQYCTIEDTHIYGTSFNFGISGLPGSGGSVTNLTVTGGVRGISHSEYRPTPLLTGVRLVGQSEHAIRIGITRGPLIVTGFQIESPASPAPSYNAVHCNTNFIGGGGLSPDVSNLIMVDGTITVNAGGGPAIFNGVQDVCLQNVFVKADTVIDSGSYDAPSDVVTGSTAQWTEVVRYAFGCKQDASHLQIDGLMFDTSADDQEVALIKSGSTPPADLLTRHVWDSGFPSWEDTQLLRVTDAPFGATPDDDSDDDGPAIQSALDAVATLGPHFGKTVFLPRGHFHLESGIEVPVGVNFIGASQTISVLDTSTGWLPSGPTAVFSTENGVGTVNLANFAIVGNHPSVDSGTEAQRHLTLARIQSSDTLWRDIQVDQKGTGGNTMQADASLIVLEGSAGGRFYNLNVEHGGPPFDTGFPTSNFHLLHIRDTCFPISIYAPSIEHLSEGDGQFAISNAGPVSVYAAKFEGSGLFLDARGVDRLYLFGGSGNYGLTNSPTFMTLENCRDVRIAVFGRRIGASEPTGTVFLSGLGSSLLADRNFCYFAHLEDLAEDGIPDLWQRHWFGSGLGPEDTIPMSSGAALNADGDSWNHLEEYVLGLNPLTPELGPSLRLSTSGGTLFARFDAAAASGVGYEGTSREFKVLHSYDLKAFAPLEGMGWVTGSDSEVEVMVPISTLGDSSFFSLQSRVR